MPLQAFACFEILSKEDPMNLFELFLIDCVNFFDLFAIFLAALNLWTG